MTLVAHGSSTSFCWLAFANLPKHLLRFSPLQGLSYGTAWTSGFFLVGDAGRLCSAKPFLNTCPGSSYPPVLPVTTVHIQSVPQPWGHRRAEGAEGVCGWGREGCRWRLCLSCCAFHLLVPSLKPDSVSQPWFLSSAYIQYNFLKYFPSSSYNLVIVYSLLHKKANCWQKHICFSLPCSPHGRECPSEIQIWSRRFPSWKS